MKRRRRFSLSPVCVVALFRVADVWFARSVFDDMYANDIARAGGGPEVRIT